MCETQKKDVTGEKDLRHIWKSPTKLSNTLKQFVGYWLGLALKGLNELILCNTVMIENPHLHV